MKKQNAVLILGLLAAAAGAAYYFFFRKTATAARPLNSAGGASAGTNYVPVSSAPRTSVAGTGSTRTTPSLTQQLVTSGANALSSLVSSLLGGGKSGGAGGGGGSFGSGTAQRGAQQNGSGRPGLASSSDGSGSSYVNTNSDFGALFGDPYSNTTFGEGVSGSTFETASGSSYTETNANFGDLFGDPNSGDNGFGTSTAEDAAWGNSGGELTSVDSSGYWPDY